jgi:hypothetical protein
MRPAVRVAFGVVAAAGLALGAPSCVTDVELVHAPGAQTTAARWTLVPSGTTSDLRRVWGSAPDDVWAVGEGGTAIHWDGSAWRAVPTGTTATLSGVWVARANEAWAVGSSPAGPVVLRWDGERWSEVALGPRERLRLRSVWGSGPTDVWAAGFSSDSADASLWHWNGSQWRPESPPRSPELSSLGGRGPEDLWAVGMAPVLLHRVGGAWSTPVLPPRGAQFGGELCVAGDGAVWVTAPGSAIHRYRAPAWTTLPLEPGTALRGLWCGSGDDVWGVGQGGRIVHWDGASWSTESAGGAELWSVWDSDAGERWAVGAQGTVLRRGP